MAKGARPKRNGEGEKRWKLRRREGGMVKKLKMGIWEGEMVGKDGRWDGDPSSSQMDGTMPRKACRRQNPYFPRYKAAIGISLMPLTSLYSSPE
jgi:hypothetical protein